MSLTKHSNNDLLVVMLLILTNTECITFNAILTLTPNIQDLLGFNLTKHILCLFEINFLFQKSF